MNRKQRRAVVKAGPATVVQPKALLDAALGQVAAGRPIQAEALFRKVLALCPDDPSVLYDFGVFIQQTGRAAMAAAAWRRALVLRPAHARTLNNLANAVAEQGGTDMALRLARAAVRVDDATAEIHCNLGLILWQAGQWARAADQCRRALILRPDQPDALNGLGIVLADQGCLKQAVVAYRAAIAIQPGFAKAHFNLSLALLAAGIMPEGWDEFEWRWLGSRTLRPPAFTGPAWDGRHLAGESVLLYAEQGFGDAIQFVRFVPMVAARGATVILEVPSALVRLFTGIEGVARVLASGERRPRFQFHLPLMSVPRVLGLGLADILVSMPYVLPPAEGGPALQPSGRPTVGLVWAGDPRPHDPVANAKDRRRSLALSRLLPLLSNASVRFVSLQMGEAARQLSDIPEDLRPLDVTQGIGDFADTARLLAGVDLVVTVDTAVAHLAGALGRPVWILSRYDACWRWLRDRRDSPWYPQARVFRQDHPGDWDGVVRRVAEELAGSVFIAKPWPNGVASET